MPFEKELGFLRDVFAKSRVSTSLISESDDIEKLKKRFDGEMFYRLYTQQIQKFVSAKTMYKLRDSLGLYYIYFLLPGEERSVFIVGPYHNTAPTRERLLSLGEKNGISPRQQKYFEEYILGIPEITEESPLLLMLDRFCEIIWESETFAIIELDKQDDHTLSPINEASNEEKNNDVLVNATAIEVRYAFENRMIQAVSSGQLQMEKQLITSFSEEIFEKRLSNV